VHTAVDGSAKEFSHLLATAWAERYR
jgi:hypothetical protein